MTTKSELKWVSKKEWGYKGRTYRADDGAWNFHIGRVGSEWILRGWGPSDGFVYRPVKTLAAAKQLAAAVSAASNRKGSNA